MKVGLFVITGLVIAALILAPFASASPNYAVTYDFEESVAPWTPGDSLSRTRETLLLGKGEGVTCTNDQSIHYAQLTARGFSEDELLWLETSVPAEGAVTVTLDWFTRDVSSCGSSCVVVAYVGASPPMPEEFVPIYPTYPAQYWKPYQYQVPLSAEHTAYVAIGIRVTGGSALPGIPQAGVDCATVQVESNSVDNP